jgi:acetylglutamate kinase
LNWKTLRQAIADSKLVILPPFSLGEKGRLWILDPNQLAFEVATRLRAKKTDCAGHHCITAFCKK